MDINNLKGLMEAYQQVNAPQEVDEATAMAKRGYDEAPIRQKIAKSTGGGEAADRASALEKKSTFGDAKKEKQRQNLARKQRGDFRSTTSSSPGLHGYGHKSDDPKVKAKQAARGAQRGALTPAEKKQFNREEFELWVNSLVEEGYDLSEYTWDEMYDIYEAERPIYGRGGGLQRTQTALQVLGKHATARDKKKLHNIPKGGTTISTGDSGKLMSGEYDRGKGSKAARRAAALKKPEPKKSFPNRLRRNDGQGIRDSYEYDIFDVVLEFLQVEGYAETLEEAEWMMANLIDEEAIDIILGEENVNEIFGLGGRSAKDRLANSDYMKKKNKEADEKAIQNLRDMMSKDPERQKRPSRINNESFKAWLDEAMSNYEKNRKRAAQRAAARNAARDQGKTGAVPGVGYVTPRRERETWTDESGKTRHAKGL